MAGCGKGSAECKSAGTGPSCIDTSHPANANSNVNVTFSVDGQIKLTSDKDTCVANTKERCAKALDLCIRTCIAKTEDEIYQRNLSEADGRTVTLVATSNPISSSPRLDSCVSHLGAYANWKCWAACGSEVHCDTTSCYCSEITCGSGTFTVVPPAVRGRRREDTKSVTPSKQSDDKRMHETKRAITELRLTRSNYDIPIEAVFGRHYVAGNVIWIGNAVRGLTEAGAFERGDGTYANPSGSYTYFDFALAVAVGPIDAVGKIYVNDILVSDTQVSSSKRSPAFFGAYTGNTETYTQRGSEIILYSGGESQLSNPYMAHDGLPVVAYRGISYVFFRRFPISTTTAQFPSIVVEVIERANVEPNLTQSTTLAAGVGGNMFALAPAARSLSVDGSITSFDLDAFASPPTTLALSSIAGAYEPRTLLSTARGNYFAQTGMSSPTRTLALFDGRSGEVLATKTNVPNTAMSGGTRSFVFNALGEDYYAAVSANILSVYTYTEVPGSIGALRYVLTVPGGDILYGQVYAEGLDTPGGRIRDRYMGLVSGGAGGLTITRTVLSSNGSNTMSSSILPTRLWEDSVDVSMRFAVYDGGSDASWLIGYTYSAGLRLGRRIVRYSPRSGIVSWVVDVPALPPSVGGQPVVDYPTRNYRYVSEDGRLVTIDKVTGAYSVTQTASPASGKQVYDGAGDRVYYRNASGILRLSGRTLTRIEMPLSEAVRRLCASLGIPESQIDARDLETIPFVGYKLISQDGTKDALEELAAVYQFRVFAKNGILVFTRLSSTQSFTVSEGVLASSVERTRSYVSDTGVAVAVTNQATITYSDTGHRQFSEHTQTYRRPSGMSGDTVAVDTLVALSSTQAARYAERLVYTAAQEQTKDTVVVGPRYSQLNVGDVLNITRSDGVTERWRVSSSVFGSNLQTEYALAYVAQFGEALDAVVSPAALIDPEPVETNASTHPPYVWSTRYFGEPSVVVGGSIPFYVGVLYYPDFVPTTIYRGDSVVGTAAKPLYVGRRLSSPTSPIDPQTRQVDDLVVLFDSPTVVEQLSNAVDTIDYSDIVRDRTRGLLFVGDELVQYGAYSVGVDGLTVTFSALYRGRGGTDVYIGDPIASHTRVIVYNAGSVLTTLLPVEAVDGVAVELSTISTVEGNALRRTSSVLGDHVHASGLPPFDVRVTSVAPVGHTNATGRKLFFTYKRRSRIETAFSDSDYASLAQAGVNAAPDTWLYRRRLTRVEFLAHLSGGSESTYLGDLDHPWGGLSTAAPVDIAVQTADQRNRQNRGSAEPGTTFNILTHTLQLVISEPATSVDPEPYFTAVTWLPGVKTELTPPDYIERWHATRINL
jgi:Putative phage tail protein